MATEHTSRMTALLGAMRRERNGAVADTMAYYGKPYGLNYGVSLPTVRQLARAERRDHDFARYLWLQDVRELRLAALRLADPAQLAPGEFDFWAAGITTSELAEEAAFALLPGCGAFAELFGRWTEPDAAPLRQYAALLAAARREEISAAQINAAFAAVRRQAEATDARAARLVAQGAVALLAAAASQNDGNRRTVIRMSGSLGSSAAEELLREELAWRLEG